MRYPDLFRNALMSSHQMTARGEFWYNGAFLAPFDIVSGSVSADRAGSVRRTAQVSLNPHAGEIPAMKDRLSPYGTYIKLFRGLRYPNGTREEFQVFFGRIDQVEEALQTLTIRCSDRAADIIDARFEDTRWAGTFGTIGTLTCADCAKALILDVIPSAAVTIDITDPALAALKVSGDTSWTRERSDALDQMSGACGAEWFASMYGDFYVRQLPAVATANTVVKWIIDTGDTGVLVTRTNVNDRQGVYNHVVVVSEPFDGREPARGNAYDNTDPNSPTYYGGAFGKVTGFFEGQQVDSNANADKLAGQLLQQAIAAVKSISVECVANPQLQLADVVRVFDPRNGIDAMFFVQSFELPLDPETPMRMVLYSARQQLAKGVFGDMPKRLPKGASWQPTP
jgi:hypothetical protein